MSSQYSCWPVMMVTYNLPPCLCMGRKFTMLTMLISGPKQPGSLPSCSYSRSIPVDICFQHSPLRRKHTSLTYLSLAKNCSQFNNLCVPALMLTPSTSCSRNHNHINGADSDPSRSHRLFQQFYLSINAKNDPNQDPGTKNQKQGREGEYKGSCSHRRKELSSNMWWVNLKAALGQRLNFEGIVSSVAIIAKDRHLALPHVVVPNVRYIDWVELHRRGFKGVVFDKDNTITAPYCLTLWGPLTSSLEQCKFVFGHDIAVFSNSAGLYEYDHDGSKARALEEAIGIKVIRHRVKKPACTAEEIEKHFGYKSSQLVIVGDRPFTDVVFGNRNGFLTILTEPLSISGEPFVVRQVRKLEIFLVNCWLKKGTKPISHSLLPDVKLCIKDP